MLRGTSIIVTLLSSILTLSQSSYQIADTLKSWNNLECGLYPVNNCLTSTVKFEGDTIIDSKSYLKVYESWDSLQQFFLVGYLYEDLGCQEVYFRNEDNEEGMIYDFSLNLSDTILINNTLIGTIYPYPIFCYQIDSISIGNEFYKRYFLSKINQPIPEEDEIWIEHIGSTHGMLYSGYRINTTFMGGFKELLCYSEDDSIIYMNPPFYQCYMDEFYPKIIDETYDTAFVGMSYEFPISITDTTEADSVTWSYEIMPENFWFDTVNGVLHGIPAETGSFRCKVVLKNWGYYIDWLDTNIVVTYPLTTESLLKPIGKIFPNPTDGLVNVENYSSNDMHLRLFSATGSKLLDCRLDKQNLSLDLSRFPSGIYCLSIYNNHGNINYYQVILKH